MRKTVNALAILLSLLLFSWNAPAQGQAPSSLKAIDLQLNDLANYIDGYPPQIKDDAQKKEVEKKWNATLAELTKLAAKSPPDAEIEWRLGDAYRMGHNLDLKDTWENSEKHLKKAIELAPNMITPHLILGTLYVNTNPKYATTAEAEFRKALELAGNNPPPEAYRGLFFAYYYQGKPKEAADEADLYLKLRPNDAQMVKLRDVARTRKVPAKP